MIVADADLISYFWLEVNHTDLARAVRRRENEWAAPVLWRSEICSVLSQHMQHRSLSLSDAARIAVRIEADLEDRTFDVPTEAVLELAHASGHSAYDCEYVALAQRLGVPLVTGDQQVARRFSETAVLMESFVAE